MMMRVEVAAPANCAVSLSLSLPLHSLFYLFVCRRPGRLAGQVPGDGCPVVGRGGGRGGAAIVIAVIVVAAKRGERRAAGRGGASCSAAAAADAAATTGAGGRQGQADPGLAAGVHRPGRERG